MTPAVARADLWRLLAAGAVIECARDGELGNCIIVDGRVVPVKWKQAPDPEVEGGVFEWGELQFDVGDA